MGVEPSTARRRPRRRSLSRSGPMHALARASGLIPIRTARAVAALRLVVATAPVRPSAKRPTIVARAARLAIAAPLVVRSAAALEATTEVGPIGPTAPAVARRTSASRTSPRALRPAKLVARPASRALEPTPSPASPTPSSAPASQATASH